MPFIGKNPTSGFSTIVKDDLTPDGSTTAFTLSKNVASANDIAVFVGNVRQEPTDAYSVSGTTLTMTAAPASGINFYVLHIAGTLESSVIPADDTISTAKIQADAITDAKLSFVDRTDSLHIPTGTTAQRPGSPVAGDVRWNTSLYQLETYDGTSWNLSNTAPSYTADFLIVAGGGGGGYSPAGTYRGGGGGAGGLRTSYGSNSGGGASAESSITLEAGVTYAVVVGQGGAGGSSSSGQAPSGGTSSLIGGSISISAAGGGGGGNYGPNGGSSGGSGGGASGGTSSTSSGTAGQGYGGAGGNPAGYASGTGGGANSDGAGGGQPLNVSITGSSVQYASGGIGYWSPEVQQTGNNGNGGDTIHTFTSDGNFIA
jgi:hypothetical protein